MSPVHGRHCEIFEDVEIGENTRIGNFVMIRSGTIIGNGCTIGSHADIEGDARIGNSVSLHGNRTRRGAPSASVMRDCPYDGPQMRMLVSGGRK